MSRQVKVIGPCMNRTKGPRYVRPEGWAALDYFGRELESAEGESASELFTKTIRGAPVSPATVALTATDLKQLGRALRRIAAGEDARHVFAQNKIGHRQGDKPRKQAIALAYWRTLAAEILAGTSDRAAKKAAITAALRPQDKTVDPTSIVRYATALRDSTLFVLQHREPEKFEALRQYLERHTRRGNWD